MNKAYFDRLGLVSQPSTLYQFGAHAEPWRAHTARTRYPRGAVYHEHGHDFAEVFWIEAGRGMHMLNGVSYPLEPGHVCLLSGEDAHSFLSTEGLLITSVAFPSALVSEMKERYPACMGYTWHRYLSSGGAVAPDAQIHDLASAFARLVKSSQRRLETERFLLDVLCALEATSLSEGRLHEAPPWFVRALETLASDPRVLSGGSEAFVRTCAHSSDHVNRVTRRLLGKTTTDLVNDARVEAAASLLRTTDAQILSIALEVGFDNLSNFYRRFRAHFGLTPRKYRERESLLMLPRRTEPVLLARPGA